MTAVLLPTTRLALTPSPDGRAFFTTVNVNNTPRTLFLDTSSAAGVMLACTSLANVGTNATTCLATAKRFDTCPPNSTYTYFPLVDASLCKATATMPVTLELGDLLVRSVSASVLTSNTSVAFHGADGTLGLAARSTYTTRNLNLTDQIQSFALNFAAKEPYVVLNDVDSDLTSAHGWAALRQTSSYSNASTIALRGFLESVNETFVAAKWTQASSPDTASVNAWLDAAWPSIVFPKVQFNAFHQKYLTTCVAHNETSAATIPHYYLCARSVALPRLAFTTTNGTFFLDAADYVQADPEDMTRAIVLVQNHTLGKYSSIAWGFGQPFLRKFPAYFNGTGKEHRVTLYCQAGASCDLTKWVVNGSKEFVDYDEDGSAPSPSRTTYRPSTSGSSGTQTRYWSLGITIPIFILIVLYSGRRLYRQQKVDRQRQRMLDEANEQEPPSTTALPKSSELPQSGGATTPTTTAPYSLLSGPATLTVSTNPNGTVIGPTSVPPPATGVAARWRNDLADLETRL